LIKSKKQRLKNEIDQLPYHSATHKAILHDEGASGWIAVWNGSVCQSSNTHKISHGIDRLWMVGDEYFA
tara:strand:+ start:1459 stop:1665 length:207 start_codon:yes stop_codon:yes gene_type:complete